MARNWIKGAVKHPGAFKAAAEKAGKSTAEFATEHQHDSGTLGKRARLAKTLMQMSHAEGGVVEGHAKGGEVKHVAKKHKFRKPAPKAAPPVPPEQTATDVAPAAMPAAGPMPAQATGGVVDRVASMSRAARMYGAKRVMRG